FASRDRGRGRGLLGVTAKNRYSRESRIDGRGDWAVQAPYGGGSSTSNRLVTCQTRGAAISKSNSVATSPRLPKKCLSNFAQGHGRGSASIFRNARSSPL